MIGKVWKKVVLIIVVIACLFNIVGKIVRHPSLEKELTSYLEYTNQEKVNK